MLGADWKHPVCGKVNPLLRLIWGPAERPSCNPTPPPTPIIKTPSKVITEAGLEFFVWRLKLPGSSQELKLKQAGA